MKRLCFLTIVALLMGCAPEMEAGCGGGTIGVIGGDVHRFYAVKDMGNPRGEFEGMYFDEERGDGLISGTYSNGKFIINTHDGREMYFYDVATKEYHTFEQVEVGWLFAPVWSPNETAIAVEHWVGDDRTRLMIYDLNTLTGKGITELKEWKEDFLWAWTEEGIYFSRHDGWRREEYYLYHPEDGSMEKVTSYPEWGLAPTGDKELYVDRETGKIVLKDLESEQETVLTNLPELAEQITWSPNGKCLAYSINGPGKIENIYIYTFDNEMTISYKLPYPANSVFMDWTKPR